MTKRFYYKDDDHYERGSFHMVDDSRTNDSASSSRIIVDSRTGEVIDGKKRLFKLKKQVIEGRVNEILNGGPIRRRKYYQDIFLFGKNAGTDPKNFRNDPHLAIDFGKLKKLHDKLKDEGELKKDSNFYSWIHSYYEDPISEFPWITLDEDWAKIPKLKPDVQSLVLGLKTLLNIKTNRLIRDLKISIVPMAQDKLLVLTMMPSSTQYEFHAKQMEYEYVDVLQRIFKNNKKESRIDNNGMWDFIGTNDDKTISLKFEFKFFSSEDFTKKDKFDAISRKRLERTRRMILSFRNFFSQHNKRYYEFSRDDFKAIDTSLTRSLHQFRNEYQKYFDKLDKSKKVEEDLEKNLRDIKRKNVHNERFILETEERLKENSYKHQYELKKMNDKINQLNEMLVKAIEEK